MRGKYSDFQMELNRNIIFGLQKGCYQVHKYMKTVFFKALYVDMTVK